MNLYTSWQVLLTYFIKDNIMKHFILLAISFLILSGCLEQRVDQQAEGKKLMELSREWARAETPDEILSFWADEAIVMPPGQASLKGKDAIRQMLEGTSEIPGFEVSWEPKEFFVSKSGDLAYLIEQNYFKMRDSEDNPLTTFNKVVTIWKKQDDGAWKNVVDIWNEDPSISSIK